MPIRQGDWITSVWFWWKIDRKIYETENDLAVDGYFYIGKNRNYLLGRNSTISLNGENGEIWVTAGSIITLQIDSKLVNLTEYAL